MLDGLEVTVVGAIGGVLEEGDTLHLTGAQVGLSGSAYLAGAILGSLLFGWLTDRLGRKRLFMVTLGIYLVSTTATACSWSFVSFAAFRFITGAGIGGEYAATSSAIDELLPARVRGWADLAIGGSFWLGTALGAAATLVLLRLFGHVVGWRAAFGLGAFLGLGILFLRRHVPESPRWLIVHGRVDEAEAIVSEIEADVRESTGLTKLPEIGRAVSVDTQAHVQLGDVARVLFGKYRLRSVYCLALMSSQAFFYNAIFFTYSLVLTTFYGVPSGDIGRYIFPFAVGNFMGPILLGRFFDSHGRRRMIAITYAASGVLLALTGWAFANGLLTAATQTLLWSLIFFIASAAASSAYLTISEIFPIRMRALTIAIFYAIGTTVGGLTAPAIFGVLIQTHSRQEVFLGYLVGGVLMMVAAVIAAIIGVDAERKSLEEIAS